ncbi:hypothetical protein CCR94_14405 [Rhodoblastus sphagnicola]|uniref:Uncharacterized protein n=1 Tax=Rhodoblastus sphagnicola TaxID=333368 RepID=A0A2S6N5F3_9HYPH|nr:hypothetical protein CCR94_14405 [Rhodoblastus sphagnicola]
MRKADARETIPKSRATHSDHISARRTAARGAPRPIFGSALRDDQAETTPGLVAHGAHVRQTWFSQKKAHQTAGQGSSRQA